MEGAEFGGGGEGPPGHLGKADAVFASDDTTPSEDLTEEVVQGGVGAVGGTGLGGVDHDVDVDIAVAGMAEAGDGEAVLFLQARGEAEEVFETAARDDDVLIE